jgi:hypothetical protein
MSFIKIFEHDAPERDKLNRLAHILTGLSPRGYRYYVGETYFDFGQDWKWTTVLCDGGNYGGYQALNPREQEDAILADISELPRIAQEILTDKYCPDRVT